MTVTLLKTGQVFSNNFGYFFQNSCEKLLLKNVFANNCPRGNLPTAQGWGFGKGWFQGWGVNQTIVPEENCPWLLGLGFGVGGQFSQNLPPQKLIKTRIMKLISYQLVFGRFTDFSRKRGESLQKTRKKTLTNVMKRISLFLFKWYQRRVKNYLTQEL